MSNGQIDADTQSRWALSVFGAVSGLSFYLLLEFVDAALAPRLLMALGAFLFAYSYLVLALTGPTEILRALVLAAPVAVLSAGLLVLASLRFDMPTQDPAAHIFFAFSVLVLLSAPYVIAFCGSSDGSGWLFDYMALFHESWGIFVRGFCASLFLGLFWALLMLSNALFDLIGLTIIEDLLDIKAVPFVLSGAVFGLAVGVIYELRDFVTPFLALRLLRLLILPVLLVITVFLVGVPIVGLKGLFGSLSTAAILLAIAAVGATLVSTAADATAEEAIHLKTLRGAAAVLSFFLLPLAGLAFYAVLLRVEQYGWTPERLQATAVTLIAVIYAICYFAASLPAFKGGNWMARIRWVNARLAFGLIVISALWLTPLIPVERWSAQSQLARFEAGLTQPSALPFQALERDWGKAGTQVLQLLREEKAPENNELAAAILSYDLQPNSFGQVEPSKVEIAQATIAENLIYLPSRTAVENLNYVFEVATSGTLNDISRGCSQKTPLGNPGCFAVNIADPAQQSEPQTVIYYVSEFDGRIIRLYQFDPVRAEWDYVQTRATDLPPVETIDAAFAGKLQKEPRQIFDWKVDGQILMSTK